MAAGVTTNTTTTMANVMMMSVKMRNKLHNMGHHLNADTDHETEVYLRFMLVVSFENDALQARGQVLEDGEGN